MIHEYSEQLNNRIIHKRVQLANFNDIEICC